MHDACLFRNSPQYTSVCSGSFNATVYQTISAVRVPPLILGDAAYPLKDWLMKPYVDHGNLSHEEIIVNNHPSITRVVVENAFGRLKGRFNSCTAQFLWTDEGGIWWTMASWHRYKSRDLPCWWWKPETGQECCSNQGSHQNVFVVNTLCNDFDLRFLLQQSKVFVAV